MDKVPAPILLARLARGSIPTPTNYFNEALMIQKDPQASQPFWTFADNGTAFHLNRDPSIKQMLIDQVAEKYRLPDLCPALMEFIHHYMPSNSAPYLIGDDAAQ